MGGDIPTPYVLWHGTNGVFKYARRMNQLGTYDSLALAIASQSGSSGASTAHVPDLLLNVLEPPAFSDIRDMRYVAGEPIDVFACHRLAGTRKGKQVDLWVEKNSHLLRQIRTLTQFGTATEIHRNMIVDAEVEDALVSFVPPADVEHVEKFDPRKNSKR